MTEVNCMLYILFMEEYPTDAPGFDCVDYFNDRY